MLNMEIKYGEMVIRIFNRVFAPWEFESDYGSFIADGCSTIITCTDAVTNEIVGGGNNFDGIKYNVDAMGKHYMPLIQFLSDAVHSTNPNMAILEYCKNELTTHGNLFEYVNFIN